MNTRGWCVRACVRRLVCLECQQAWKPNSIRRHSILGWKRGGTHPSAGLLFHDAGGTGGGGRGGTRLAGGGVEWRYLRNKEMVHRTSNNNVPPPPRPAIVIRVVSCIRIVRSINHRAKRSGDFLTPFPSRREGRDRRRRRITFPDRNDDCTRLRKRSNSFVVVVVVVVRNC